MNGLLEADPVPIQALPMGSERIDALDMTKGVLVMLMVVYHSFNYSSNYTLGFNYLPFLPASFILITGFLISYRHRHGKASRRDNPFRMSLRGMRLLLIFTLLNVAGQLLGQHKVNAKPQEIAYFFDQWFEVYVTGEARVAAFIILLPIAYLLIFAPLIVVLDRISRLIIPMVALLLFGYTWVLGRRGELEPNFSLLMAGIVGVVLGQVSGDFLRSMGRYWLLALAAYSGYLGLAKVLGQTAIMHLLGAGLAVGAIFCCCLRAGDKNFLQRRLVRAGKYSLLAYILQIVLLQILGRFFGKLQPFSQAFLIQMLVVAFVMIGLAEALEWLRGKSKGVDTFYRAAFA